MGVFRSVRKLVSQPAVPETSSCQDETASIKVAPTQIVIVTGGARGIGYGIASCFARTGAALAIVDLDGAAARQAAERLNEMGAVGAIGLKCDVTAPEQVAATVDQVIRIFERIDVLVNNAGICPFQDIMEMSVETWKKTLDVNINGALHFTREVARRMIARGEGGRVISITSLAENVAGPFQVDYAASKAGLRMATVGFATKLGPHGITCNNVAPGIILTDMSAQYWTQPGPAEEIKKRVPMGRIGTPEDIGHAVLFLASPQAQYINGVTLRVDGGHQACAV